MSTLKGAWNSLTDSSGQTGGLKDIMGGETGGFSDIMGGTTGGISDVQGKAKGQEFGSS
jgi:hypothetical protein